MPVLRKELLGMSARGATLRKAFRDRRPAGPNRIRHLGDSGAARDLPVPLPAFLFFFGLMAPDP